MIMSSTAPLPFISSNKIYGSMDLLLELLLDLLLELLLVVLLLLLLLYVFIT